VGNGERRQRRQWMYMEFLRSDSDYSCSDDKTKPEFDSVPIPTNRCFAIYIAKRIGELVRTITSQGSEHARLAMDDIS